MVRRRSASCPWLHQIPAILLIGLVTMPAFAFSGHGVKKQDCKREVEALEQQWRQAQLTGDIATMDRLLADDYIGINITGQVNTKAQQLERARKHIFQITSIDLIDMKVRLLGKVAVVTSLASVIGTNAGSPVVGNFRYTRVYEHLPTGSWRITNFEATRIPDKSRDKDVLASRNERPG